MDKTFEKQSDNSTWIEKQNGLEYARFKFVQEMNGHVLLLDEKRKLYVQLSGVSCYAGSDENALTKLVNSGQWVIHEDEKPTLQNNPVKKENSKKINTISSPSNINPINNQAQFKLTHSVQIENAGILRRVWKNFYFYC